MSDRMITSYETVNNFYNALETERQILKTHSDNFDAGQSEMEAVTLSDDLPQMKAEFEAVQSVLRDVFVKVDDILNRTDRLRKGIQARMSVS